VLLGTAYKYVRSRGDSKEGGSGGGRGEHGPSSQRSAPTDPQVKFLASVIKKKFSDSMLVLCQKLHICIYDRQNFPVTGLTIGDLCPPLPSPKVQVLEPPLVRSFAYYPPSRR